MSVTDRAFIGEMRELKKALNEIRESFPRIWPDVAVHGSISPKQYWAGVALGALIQRFDDLEKSAALGELTLGESALGMPGTSTDMLVERAWEYAEAMTAHETQNPNRGTR